MRALLISGIYPPDIGGPATYLPKLAQSLVSQGIEVTIISLSEGTTDVRSPELWERNFVLRNQNKFLRTYKLVRLIRMKAKKSDYVFANGLFIETAIGIFGLKIKSTAKVVGDPVWERLKNNHETNYSVEEFANKFTGFRTLLQREIYNTALSRFQNLTSPGESLAKIISNWGIDQKVHVIANGTRCVDVTKVEREFDVVSLSRLVNWKRIDVLIEACAIANLKLAIAGEGPEELRLRNLATQTNGNITFLGHLDSESATQLLRKSNIFVLISDYEGLSFALIEAMMLGKKILVSDTPGNAAVITNNVEGFVTSNYSAVELAKYLILLNSEKSEISLLGERARLKAIENFCEEKQLQSMVDLIKSGSK